MGVLILFFYILLFAAIVLVIVGQWKLFEKAGEAGWKSLIPFYNSYILFKIAWGSGIYFLLMFVPVANVIVSIMLQFKMARAYGQGDGFAFGLLFLPYIFYLILGFGDSEYLGPDGQRAQPTYVINQYNYNSPEAQPAQANNVQRALDAANYDAPRAISDMRNQMDEPEFKFCTNCGEKIATTAKFCKYCGAMIVADPIQPEPIQPEPIQPEPIQPEPTRAQPQPQPEISRERQMADTYDEPYDFEAQMEETVLERTGSFGIDDRTEILVDESVNLGPQLRMTRIDDGTGISDEFTVIATPYVLGRSEEKTDHIVESRGVSRLHAQIDFTDGSFSITDLNSTNGVKINDNRIPPMEQTGVENGDIIKIGECEYIVEVLDK